jgi:transcription termination factor Rho
MYDILELSKKLLPELKDIAKELKIKKAETLKKQDLIYKILDHQAIPADWQDKTARPERKERKPNYDFRRNIIRSSQKKKERRLNIIQGRMFLK